MLEIRVTSWDKSRAWTDWGGHFKTDLVDRLGSACPSLDRTARKRLAAALMAGSANLIVVEKVKYAESLCHILEATGATLLTKLVEADHAEDRKNG